MDAALKRKQERLQRVTADLSFERLEELKDQMGMKEFHDFRNEKIQKASSDEESESDDSSRKDNGSHRFSRANKNCPIEISAKRPVSRKRVVVEELGKAKARDPRFDPLIPHDVVKNINLNNQISDKRYAFLRDYRQKEVEMLRNDLKACKDPEEKQRLHRTLTRFESQMNAMKEKERKQSVKRGWLKDELMAVQQGKRPFYLKKSEQKKLELIDRYKSIKGVNDADNNSRRIDKLLEKRRKRNASKDVRKLVSRNTLLG